MKLNHGQQVRYVGPTDRARCLTHGSLYTLCGAYPPLPMKGAKYVDEVSIYVDDPNDDFGGVIGMPPACSRR